MQPAAEVQVDDTGEEEYADRQPSDGPKALPDRLEETLPEFGWLDRSQQGRADYAKEEHPAKPYHGGENVYRDVGVVQIWHFAVFGIDTVSAAKQAISTPPAYGNP
jgi:hypothetical protein